MSFLIKKNNLSKKNKVFIFLGDFFDHGDLYFFIAFMPLMGPLFFSSSSLMGPWLLYWLSTVLAYPLSSWFFGSMANGIILKSKKNHRDPQNDVGLLLGKILFFLSLITIILGSLPSQRALGSWGFLSPFLVLFLRTIQCFLARGQRTIGRLFLISQGTFTQSLFRSMTYEIWSLLSIGFATFGASYILQSHIEWIWRLVFIGFGLCGILSSIIFLRSIKKEFQGPTENLSFHENHSSFPQNLDGDTLQKSSNSSLFSEEFSQDIDTKGLSFLTLQNISPVFLWLSLGIVGGFSYVTYSLSFHFLPQFISQVMVIDFWKTLRHTGWFFFLDILLVLVAFLGIFLLWKKHLKCYKKVYEYQSPWNKSLFVFLSKAMMGTLMMWIFFVPLGFLSLHFFNPFPCFVALRFFVIVLGVFYSALFYLWSAIVHKAMGHNYKILGITQSVGTLAIGHSLGFLCSTLFHYVPYFFSPGIYMGFLGFVTYIMLKKLLRSLEDISI